MKALTTDTTKKREEPTLSEFLEETRDGDGEAVGVMSRIPQKPVTTRPGEAAGPARQPGPARRGILTTSGLDDIAGSISRRRKTDEILAQRAKLAEAGKKSGADEGKGTGAGGPKAGPKAGGGPKKAGAK